MRLLVDTNILLYAANRDAPEHPAASETLRRLDADGVPWCLTWAIVYEFLRVATHPAVFPTPLRAEEAMRFLAPLLQDDRVTLLSASPRHPEVLVQVLAEIGDARGNLFHDVHTAVLMREHGVAEIYTADADFSRFGFLRTTNPVRRR